MVILRPTQKLRSALRLTEGFDGESDTALGDWYANRIVVDSRPLLLLVSSNSLLPLLLPARDVRSLPERLPTLVATALRRLGVTDALIAAEVAAMSQVVIAPTRAASPIAGRPSSGAVYAPAAASLAAVSPTRQIDVYLGRLRAIL